MMELTAALLILLFSRSFFLGEDIFSLTRAIKKSLFETAAIAVIFSWLNPVVIVLVIFLWGINLAHSRAERRRGQLMEGVRLAILPATLVLFSIALSPAFDVTFARHGRLTGELLGRYLLLPGELFTPWALPVLAGLLLCGKESNLAVRCLLGRLGLRPTEQGTIVEPASYRNGRAIGTLERVLIFVFVLVDQFTAIAFILAAKGFTRFKDLDKRSFAEYVLIGTLSSFTLALGIAFLVRLLAGG